jgi:HlyD family secretion protein
MISDTSSTDIVRPAKRFILRMPVIVIAGIIVLVGCAFAYPRYRDWSDTERSYPLERIRIAEVQRGAFEQSVAADGKIVAQIKPTLFAPTEGVITLQVKAGDIVSKGSVLATIVNSDLTTKLKQAETALVKAQIEQARQELETRQAVVENEEAREVSQVKLATARRNLARYEKAQRGGAVSLYDFEKAQDELAITERADSSLASTSKLLGERLQFEVRSRALEIQQQRVLTEDFQRQVEELTIRAPISGQIGTVLVEDQDSVALNQAVMTVVDLTAYGVLLQVPESYAKDLAIGLPTAITYEGLPYRGEITSMSAEVIGNSIEARAKFIDKPDGDLKQNQRVSLKIYFRTIDDTIKLARGPFLEAGGGKVAYVVEGNQARAVPIKLGAIGTSEVEVVAGLKPGDRVVISNTQVFENASNVLLR